tara:strand:- start:139 stop:573 length:435 start_codon:yes stop_codon:yes gene_type:complete
MHSPARRRVVIEPRVLIGDHGQLRRALSSPLSPPTARPLPPPPMPPMPAVLLPRQRDRRRIAQHSSHRVVAGSPSGHESLLGGSDGAACMQRLIRQPVALKARPILSRGVCHLLHRLAELAVEPAIDFWVERRTGERLRACAQR